MSGRNTWTATTIVNKVSIFIVGYTFRISRPRFRRVSIGTQLYALINLPITFKNRRENTPMHDCDEEKDVVLWDKQYDGQYLRTSFLSLKGINSDQAQEKKIEDRVI